MNDRWQNIYVCNYTYLTDKYTKHKYLPFVISKNTQVSFYSGIILTQNKNFTKYNYYLNKIGFLIILFLREIFMYFKNNLSENQGKE